MKEVQIQGSHAATRFFRRCSWKRFLDPQALEGFIVIDLKGCGMVMLVFRGRSCQAKLREFRGERLWVVTIACQMSERRLAQPL